MKQHNNNKHHEKTMRNMKKYENKNMKNRLNTIEKKQWTTMKKMIQLFSGWPQNGGASTFPE